MEKPFYRQSCKSCVYLGAYMENEGDPNNAIPYDLFYCPQAGFPTVIARYGADGPDYMSGIDSPHPALVEARSRARARGLID